MHKFLLTPAHELMQGAVYRYVQPCATPPFISEHANRGARGSHLSQTLSSSLPHIGEAPPIIPVCAPTHSPAPAPPIGRGTAHILQTLPMITIATIATNLVSRTKPYKGAPNGPLITGRLLSSSPLLLTLYGSPFGCLWIRSLSDVIDQQ